MNHSLFDRIFALLATVAVASGVAVGFWVLGTPGRQRLIAGDRERLEDLSAIANTLYWQKQDQDDYILPDVLDNKQQRQDPVTQSFYSYQKIDDENYKLCANFATDSNTYKLPNTNGPNWQHPQGLHCFELNLNQAPPSLYR